MFLTPLDFEFLSFAAVFKPRGRLYPLHDLRVPEAKLSAVESLKRQAELDRLQSFKESLP